MRRAIRFHPIEIVFSMAIKIGLVYALGIPVAAVILFEVVLNGAAARLVSVGDRVIIMTFAALDYPPPADWQPRVLVLDENNKVVSVESEGKY